MRPFLFLTVCVLCAPACKRETEQPSRESARPTSQAEPQTEPKAEAPKEPLTEEVREVQRVSGAGAIVDANIMAKLVASNQHEVMVGQTVMGRTKRPEVKAFAEMLVKDHGAALKKLQNLRIKMDLEAVDDDGVRKMREDSEEKIDKLDGKTGDDLDRAFLEMAIDDHEKTLERLDKDILPKINEGEFKAFVAGMRPTVEHHLKEAKRLRDMIKD